MIGLEYSGIDVMKIVREINNFIEHVAAVIRRIAKAIGKLGNIFNRKDKRYFIQSTLKSTDILR